MLSTGLSSDERVLQRDGHVLSAERARALGGTVKCSGRDGRVLCAQRLVRGGMVARSGETVPSRGAPN